MEKQQVFRIFLLRTTLTREERKDEGAELRNLFDPGAVIDYTIDYNLFQEIAISLKPGLMGNDCRDIFDMCHGLPFILDFILEKVETVADIEAWKEEKNRRELEILFAKRNNLAGQEIISHWTFQKGDMPKFRVERKKEIKEIMKWIEADTEDSNNSTHLVINGPGGVGKSTLVAMTCEIAYARLQCLYPDGVHWIKLGSNTPVQNSVHDFLAKLGEKITLQTRDGVRYYLEECLKNRKLLLIVDDAWNADDLEMFKFTGMSRAIVTTRFKDFARDFQWNSYELNVMSETEAVELLSKELDQEEVKSKKKILKKLAEAVDYLPLALQLLEPLLRDYQWEEILDELQHPIKRLNLLEPEGDELGAKQSLVNTFLLSLDKIKTDLRSQFAWLGILADNTPINPTMAGTLWGDLSTPLVKKKLRTLEQRSLILCIGEGAHGDTFRLHKLIHDMARSFLFRNDEAINHSDRIKSMNLSLKEAHQKLLERYREKLKNKRNGESWHNLPDDGYIHSNLFYHLEQAKQIDQQYQVLTEENNRRENGWFAARSELGQVHGFSRDMEMAWRHAEKEGNLKKQVRFALMASSLVSKTNELPIMLLEAAARYNVISGEESLAYARRISTPEIRMKALLEVAMTLKGAERIAAIEEAVDALFNEDSFGELRYAVGTIAHYVQSMGIESVDQIDRIIDAARKINDRKGMLETLLDIVPIINVERTREAIIEEVWANASDMKDGTGLLVSCLSYLPDTLVPSPKDELLLKLDPEDRAKILVGLMKRSSTPSREIAGEEWLIALDQVNNEMHKIHLLKEAAQVLPESILSRAIDRACSIEDEWTKAQALSAFAGYLSTDQMKIALQATRCTYDGMDSANALTALAIHLPDSLESEARTVAMTMGKKSSRAPALIALSRRFPSLKATLLELKEILPADALKNIGPFETTELEETVLKYAESLEDPHVRAAAHIELAGHFDGDKKQRLLHLAINAAKNVDSLEKRIDIALHLISNPIEGALDSFFNEVIESILAEVRLRLADRIHSTFNEFNFVYNRRQKQDSLAGSLVKIVEALPEEVRPTMFRRALTAFQVVGPEPARHILLWYLADNIDGEDKSSVLKEILQLTRLSGDEPLKVASLIGLAKRSRALAEICLEEVTILKYVGCREVVRAGILEYLKRNIQENVLTELLASLRSEKTGSRERTVEVIINLGRFIVKNMPERLHELYNVILSFHDQWKRVRGLEAIVVHLKPPLLLEAVKMVEEVEMPAARAKGFAAIAPHLELPQKDEILNCFLSMNSVLRWAGLLAKLAPDLPESFHSKAFEMARALENQKSRAEALCGLCLAPNLNNELIRKIYTEIRELDLSNVNSKDMACLLPKLPAQERSELIEIALQMAPEIGHEWTRSELLSILAPLIGDINAWEKAFKLAQKIKGKDQKANALTAFAMTPLARLSHIDDALKASLDVEQLNDRFDILNRINQPMKKLPDDDRKKLLDNLLRISSEKPRNDLFLNIAALLPSFRSLDSSIDKAIYQAIEDICRWWP
ncbi:MAG: NB-ARC domain-containing protein [Candidatus Aminicenantes bacterium]|nr:NB-ARC domain-containing protein [Candidatus Aminicenantes bacterium]